MSHSGPVFFGGLALVVRWARGVVVNDSLNKHVEDLIEMGLVTDKEDQPAPVEPEVTAKVIPINREERP